MRPPEILAPAGGMEALQAAVENGADAVYLGGKLFNARQYANNFNENELEAAIKYAHARNVKIYVTFNILLDNRELEEAATYLKFLYNAGTDAIIIQDLGLLYLAREIVPHLELHASTQMSIHNLAGAQFLAKQGVKRVVLARELSLTDIAEIHSSCSVELEVFVHGALCISYSGQCLMSSMIGGRSGNRGRCAQPCRLPYTLVDRKGSPISCAQKFGEHLLSPKDLNALEILPELIATGVKSFKFEGRMKRPEYVATVIRVYRQALNRYLADPKNYQATDEELKQLTQIFNRDFTHGYYLGNQGADLISYKRPNNRGVYLGRVTEKNQEKHTVKVRLELPLNVGDGIEYWVTKGGRTGVVIKKIQLNAKTVELAPAGSLVEIEAPLSVKTGDRVFKTHDLQLITKAQESIASAKTVGKIPVSMWVKGEIGTPLKLIVNDDKGNSAEAWTDFVAGKAQKRPLTREVLWDQLERLGNTPFKLVELFSDIKEEIMVPLSEINILRRNAIMKLEAKRYRQDRSPLDEVFFLKTLNKLLANPRESRPTRKPNLAVAVGDLESCKAALSAGADRIYISSEIFRSKLAGTADLPAITEICHQQGVRIYYTLPRIWLQSQEKLIRDALKEINDLNLNGIWAGNLGAIEFAKKDLAKFRLFGDYHLNIFNSLSSKFLQELDLEGLVLSPELNFQQIERFHPASTLQLEAIVHGSLPLMISEYCAMGALAGGRTAEKKCSRPCLQAVYGLKDRKNYIFPLETDQFCRMHVYNPQDLCLLESLPRFMELGFGSIRIEARKENPGYVETVTSTYRHALDEIYRGRKPDLERLKDGLKRFSPQGFTKGHYFRGVL